LLFHLIIQKDLSQGKQNSPQSNPKTSEKIQIYIHLRIFVSSYFVKVPDTKQTFTMR
jgi:hypothetical protein